MANPEHIEMLQKGVAAWNAWREEHVGLRPDLRGADLNRLFAEAGKLDAAGRVDLSGANLSQCEMSGVNLANAVLSGVDFVSAGLAGVNLEGAYLERDSSGPPSETRPAKTVSRTTVATRLKTETATIALTSLSLLEQIAAYREAVRGNNALAAEHPEAYTSLLAFLEGLSVDLEALLGDLPALGEAPREESVEHAASWAERFMGAAIPEWRKHLAPEAVGKASAPMGIILGCGALGAALTGFNPIGFGAGSMVGRWLTGELKSGVASDRITEMLDDPSGPEA